MRFILSQFLFYTSIGIVLFVPGYFLIFATRLDKKLSSLESFVAAFGASIVIVNFLVILLGRSPLHITRFSVFFAILLFCAICCAIYFFRNKKNPYIAPAEEEKPKELSKKSAILVAVLIFLTIFIKTIYFQDTIFPTTTDLGHHMYWAKTITITGNLPQYEKAEIQQDLTIGKPHPIADFIIGEHIIFAAVALISGAGFVSAFPSLVLFLIHIMSVLAIFILTLTIFKKANRYGEIIAIATLFLIGPLYALASPQAKFVSGGVIGNIIGNLFISLAIFFFVRAFAEKKSSLLAWALFISLGLAYTHHLSTLIFIFIALSSLVVFVLLNFKIVFQEARAWLKMFISPPVLSVLTMGIIFIFFLYTPTYLNASAIDTAVGAPSKASRTGLTFTQLKMTAGEARFAFALLGIILLFLARKIGQYKQAFLIGWFGSLALMSLRPDWFFIDIPSGRIASYIVFPAAIVAASMFTHLFIFIKDKTSGRNYLGPYFVLTIFSIFMIFFAANGLYDNSQTLNVSTSTKNALQTYAASGYLSANSTAQDIILKDHNRLFGDTWIKLFFMKGYNYPLSRGYVKRYTDSPSREQCTNIMISAPSSRPAQDCFAGTQIDFIMIDPATDSAQFNRLKNFWQVYSSDAVGIFYKSS